MEICCIPLKHANCYLVRTGNFFIAVDAGWPGLFFDYLKGAKQNRINTADIKYLIVTHFHPDHAGLIQEIKRLGAKFILFNHQIPFIHPMEKMLHLHKDNLYTDLDLKDNIVMEISESGEYLRKIGVSGEVIKTPGHSDDSISVVFDDGICFTGDLPAEELVMEDDQKSIERWRLIKSMGVKMIYPAHGNPYHFTQSIELPEGSKIR